MDRDNQPDRCETVMMTTLTTWITQRVERIVRQYLRASKHKHDSDKDIENAQHLKFRIPIPITHIVTIIANAMPIYDYGLRTSYM